MTWRAASGLPASNREVDLGHGPEHVVMRLVAGGTQYVEGIRFDEDQARWFASSQDRVSHGGESAI